MGYDHGLVERIADALAGMGERGTRQKNVFGGRGFLLGRTTFAIAWRDGLLVKTSPTDYAALLLRQGVSPFAPDGERPMSTWVLVDAGEIADDPELVDWLRRGLSAIR